MNDPSGGDKKRIVPVILCGGSGTRLWPVSTRILPKQLLALTGSDTMLQQTAARVADGRRFAAPILVTAQAQADAAETQLRDAGLPAGSIISEPASRNTAAAIALAALVAGEQALLLVMPSDHAIADPKGLVEAVERAVPFADDGWLVTFGMQPNRPETGYGYIRRGDHLGSGVYQAERFVEKPDAATAAHYLGEGGYEWNGGIFLFSAASYLAALAIHAGDILTDVRSAMAGAIVAGNRISPDPAAFAAVRSQSIDHAVMEHAERVAVVPVDIGWSDVGSWETLYGISPKDPNGNVLVGDVLAIDSENCLIRTEGGPLIVAIGVENLAIVATGNAIVVVPKDQSQRVQEAVKRLTDDDRSDQL